MKIDSRIILLVGLMIIGQFSFGQETKPDALMLRFPDISKDKIVFLYGEDLWVVDKKGGMARQITNADGPESSPKFSNDGSSIAFTGNYDGNTDVYTIPTEGGVPNRITYHPSADYVQGWHPTTGQIMFASGRESPSYRFSQFYLVDEKGGMPEKMPFFYIEWACFSPDGKKLAYQYLDRTFRNWKRYQGGTASQLWIYDYDAKKSEKITKYPGSNDIPMWVGDKVYFISDRGPNARMNLWSYNVSDKSFKQETKFADYDVKFPSLGPEEIIFENGGSLHTFNLKSGDLSQIDISIPTNRLSARPEMKDFSKYVNWYDISTGGKRALFEARGDLVTVPAEHGPTLNLTRTPGIAERAPRMSPDGKSIAYFSDESGEYELYTMPADGAGKPTQLTSGSKTYYYWAKWSPDSKKIAYYEKAGILYIIDVSSKKVTRVFKTDRYPSYTLDWSKDSRYLLFPGESEKYNYQILCWDDQSKKLIELTSGFYNDRNPVFSPDGKYVYYTSNRHFSPIYSDMDWAFIYPNSTKLMGVAMAKDTDPLLVPRNDVEEASKEEEESDDKRGKKKDDEEEEKDESVTLDPDGFESRAEVLPVDPGNMSSLAAVDGKVIFMEYPLAGAGKGVTGGSVRYYDIEERKAETIISGVYGYELSSDREKLLYSTGGSYGIIEVAKGKKTGDGKINTAEMKFEVDPTKEWPQIFREAWRVQRDFFYDAEMHQVDWAGMYDRYAKILPYCNSRRDVSFLIGELFGELNVGHAYNYGGDVKSATKIGVGLLGVDFELDQSKGAYRIQKIYRGAAWDPEFNSPLAAPNLKVKEGEYILAVNGIPLNGDKDPWAAFQGLQNKTVSLTVSASGNSSDARDILVKTMSSEFKIRNQNWVEMNRKKVYEATGGKIGYIYVPNTGIGGQNELMRMFQAQHNMDGLIIDERFNSGGQVPDRFIEMLNRPILSYWGRRDRKTDPSPYVVNNGPKVMLANEWAGSGGDAFPYFFKKAKVGPVVGKRTWGGLVGYSGGWPSLIDGGGVTSPNFGFYNTEGEWDVEGYGVDPDYEVENPSDAVFRGEDPQLDKAIELVMKALETYPKAPEKPKGPDRKGIGKGN